MWPKKQHIKRGSKQERRQVSLDPAVSTLSDKESKQGQTALKGVKGCPDTAGLISMGGPHNLWGIDPSIYTPYNKGTLRGIAFFDELLRGAGCKVL